MAEHLYTKTRTHEPMGKVSKWDVLDRAMRLVVYAAIIYVLLKIFKIL